MKCITLGLCLALGVVVWLPSLLAQQASTPGSTVMVPHLIRFAGVLKDSSGRPLRDVAGITFSLYREQEGGAALWLETQNATVDAAGRYDVLLGSTHSDGVPMDLFTSGEARWLGIQVQGQGEEQPRVLLVSVPYALKAADAETVGGLPPSAFMLAAPPASTTSSAGPTGQAEMAEPLATGTTPVTTAGGTVNKLAKFDAKADITNSLIFDNGTNVGIGNTSPGAKLDVSGTGMFRGALTMPATSASTATAGQNSQPFNFTASAFNSSTLKAVNEMFRWQAEPVGNNTATPLGRLNLLFGSGSTTPKETGLSISNTGLITFAHGQTFPASGGTVTSVALSAPSPDFTVSGSPVTSSGTLAFNWNVVPTNANSANAIVKRDGTGSFSAGTISAVVVQALGPSSGAAVMGSGGTGVLGQSTATGGIGVDAGAPFGGTGVFSTVEGSTGVGVFGESFATAVDSFGVTPDGVHGTAHSSQGYGVSGNNVDPAGIGVYGQGPGLAMYANGHTGQNRTSGGWVKAMVFTSGFSSGRIATCFNSTLTGTAATTPPCGFTITKAQTGDYIIDFGFEVDDRFFSVTPTYPDGVFDKACTDFTGSFCNNTLTANQVELTFSNSINVLVDTKFYLMVF